MSLTPSAYRAHHIHRAVASPDFLNPLAQLLHQTCHQRVANAGRLPSLTPTPAVSPSSTPTSSPRQMSLHHPAPLRSLALPHALHPHPHPRVRPPLKRPRNLTPSRSVPCLRALPTLRAQPTLAKNSALRPRGLVRARRAVWSQHDLTLLADPHVAPADVHHAVAQAESRALCGAQVASTSPPHSCCSPVAMERPVAGLGTEKDMNEDESDVEMKCWLLTLPVPASAIAPTSRSPHDQLHPQPPPLLPRKFQRHAQPQSQPLAQYCASAQLSTDLVFMSL
jgi:hypothetical protein